MPELVRVTKVDVVGPRVLRVEFSDGLVRELDFEGVLPGVLATIDDEAEFAQAMVDPTAGTVSWPNGIDLDPDVLHGDREPASLPGPRIVREHRLQGTP
jgi:hypothetical protein